MSKISAAPCRPGVGVNLMCLAVKNRPVFVDRISLCQLRADLSYTSAVSIIRKLDEIRKN